jgi:hypothetical protein
MLFGLLFSNSPARCLQLEDKVLLFILIALKESQLHQNVEALMMGSNNRPP